MYTREQERDHSNVIRALYDPHTLAMWSKSASGVFTLSLPTSPFQCAFSFVSSRSHACGLPKRAQARVAFGALPIPRRTRTSVEAPGGRTRSLWMAPQPLSDMCSLFLHAPASTASGRSKLR